MSEILTHTVSVVFLLFCRIGACLMLMPGFSSPRVPAQVRLFIAIAVTLALTPLLFETVTAVFPNLKPVEFAFLICSETTIGALIGLMGRVFFLGLQFGATCIAMLIGIGNTPQAAVDDTEAQVALSSLITVTATVFVFLSEQHWEILRGLMASYSVMPLGQGLTPQTGLAQLADATTNAFLLGLRIASPFLIYSAIINLLFGLANKLVPQIAVYYISTPFVLAGGLLLLFFTISEILTLFDKSFLAWLKTGGG